MDFFCKVEGTFKLSCDLPMLYTHLPVLISGNLETGLSELCRCSIKLQR